MRLRLHLWALAALVVVLGAAAATAQTVTGPPAEVRTLAGQHPAEYYRRAAQLLGQDRKDDAVFVFYLGQLRYRVHLAARRPQLRPDGDPALFASLSEVVGGPVNQYAFGDIPALARTIDAVLAYDQANPDGFTSPTEFPAVHSSVRSGLSAMKAHIIAEADSIRAQRKSNGLENRN